MRKFASLALVVGVLAGGAGLARADVTITFDSLPGSNGDTFTGPYSENGFSVTATAGDWFVAKVFGNPIPDLFAGPIGSPSLSELTVTKDGGGSFGFRQADFSSNNGRSSLTYKGYLGAALVYTNSQFIPDAIAFNAYLNPDVLTQIDRLVISIDPIGSPTSINIDNIVLTTAAVPEPSTLAIAGAAVLLGVGSRLRRRRLAA